MTTMTRTKHVTYEILECVDCGIDLVAPESFLDDRRKDGHLFYCINGHPQSYSETEEKRLRKKLDASEKRAAALDAQAAALGDQLRAAERERKRLAKRAANGVCPCCARSYVQLARHMKSKHPDYAAPAT